MPIPSLKGKVLDAENTWCYFIILQCPADEKEFKPTAGDAG
jgi:hypothetical protein